MTEPDGARALVACVADRITLRAGDLVLVLAPGVGGSIARFDCAGEPLMRPAPDDYARALDGGCFPLVPFCNRIRGGSFRFDGREIVLPLNVPGDASPLHGHGFQRAWDVVAADATSATLGFRHGPDAWPWAYEAEQHFALAPDRLTIALSCTNRSDGPMPCGLGLHPYYPCGPETRLRTEVANVWTVDADVLPVDHIPAAGTRYDLADRLICGQDLDNGYDGWGGVARIDWPDRGLALTLRNEEGARFFQLYSPPAGGLFVAEPVGHANCALNADQAEWERLGIRILAPGETLRLAASFAVSRTPA